MSLNTESSAALVFLILYVILFVFMFLGYATRRFKFASRYSVIFLHVTIRLASQATGLAFGIVGYSAIGLLVAYFILGAEGYFSLVLCTYRFLISWQNHNSASGESWLERKHPPGTPISQRFRESLILFGPKRRPMSIIHWFLVAANALIVTSGSQLAGGAKNVHEFNTRLVRAKAMRIAGQAVFLIMNVFLLYCIGEAIRTCKRERSGRVHPTLWILLTVWPFLFVRGIYGVLSGVIPLFNYFSPSNYDDQGLTPAFVISEYILATTMEWTSCALLMSTYVTSRNDPKTAEVKEKLAAINGAENGVSSQ